VPRPRKAASLEEQAQRKGKPGRAPKPRTGRKQLTPAQLAKRDAAIVRARIVLDWTWAHIAQEYGITERHARRVLADYRAENLLGLDEIEANAEVWEILSGYDAQLERYRDLLERARKVNNYMAEIAAEKGIREARRDRTSVLQEVGALPKNLGKLQVEHEVRVVVQKVMSVLDEVERGDLQASEAKRRLAEMIGAAVTPN
jgi:hypothetical protein